MKSNLSKTAFVNREKKIDEVMQNENVVMVSFKWGK